ARDARRHRGAVHGHRQQDPARPHHQAARVVAGGSGALVDGDGARAVRPGAKDVIRLGTRASALALAQAATVADSLRRLGAEVELVPMRTEGDRRRAARLAEAGGKGLFVREIEDALAAQPPGLTLAAYPPREDPRDVLVSRCGGGVEALPAGAVVGTSSLRRRALLLALRPDLQVEPLRGNVDTRLRRLSRTGVDAVVLAAAGLARLSLAPPAAVPLPPDVFVPAVGQ